MADVDSDGDGLSDWEEYLLGLNPLDAFSNGQSDAKAFPLNDYQYIVGRLTTQSLGSLLTKSAQQQLLKRDPLCGITANTKAGAAGDAPQ